MADYLVLTLDCNDLEAMTAFWTTALGFEVLGGARQYRGLGPAGSSKPTLLLQQVDEPKTAKNRLHLDLHVPDIAAETERLVAAGATKVTEVAEHGLAWTVMHDPEGNEFCICRS